MVDGGELVRGPEETLCWWCDGCDAESAINKLDNATKTRRQMTISLSPSITSTSTMLFTTSNGHYSTSAWNHFCTPCDSWVKYRCTVDFTTASSALQRLVNWLHSLSLCTTCHSGFIIRCQTIQDICCNPSGKSLRKSEHRPRTRHFNDSRLMPASVELFQ